MQTTNIRPTQNTWTLVATNPGYIRIKSNGLTDSRWWQVAITDSGEPDEEVTGEKLLGNEPWEMSNIQGEVYVRTDRSDDDFAIVIGTAAEGGGGVGGGGLTNDRELVVTTYRVKNAFTGASLNDIITLIQVVDVTESTTSTVSTSWRNQTTGVDLASAPAASNLELVGSTGVSNAELRASALVTRDMDDPFTVRNRARDVAQDVIYDYSDGTSETFYYTTAGDFAGKGARA